MSWSVTPSNAPRTDVVRSLDRDVLLVDRFDRTARAGERRLIVSALTMLGLDEMNGRYATYPELADLVRRRLANPDHTLHERFTRIEFTIAIGNTDDHARNHAAFGDGAQLELTPAYDLCPQLRSGTQANQAMAIGRDGTRAGRFAACVDAADTYHLTRGQARDLVDTLVATIREHWEDDPDAVGLTEAQRQWLWGRQAQYRRDRQSWQTRLDRLDAEREQEFAGRRGRKPRGFAPPVSPS